MRVSTGGWGGSARQLPPGVRLLEPPLTLQVAVEALPGEAGRVLLQAGTVRGRVGLHGQLQGLRAALLAHLPGRCS